MKLSVLVIAIWLQAASARRLTDSNLLSNELSANDNEIGGRTIKGWVKITKSPESGVQARAGDTIEIECEAAGSPAPVIQWYKESRELPENDFMLNEINEYPSQGLGKVKARLRIAYVQKKDAGTYYCEARSGNEIAAAEVSVSVSGGISQGSPFLSYKSRKVPARIVMYNTIYMDNIGNDIVLPCKSSGNPTPKVMWLDPSEDVVDGSSDPRVSVLPNGGLRIRNLRWNDMGQYTCVTKNLLAQDNSKTFVYPLLPEK